MSVHSLLSAEAAWIRRAYEASPPQLVESIVSRSLVWFIRQDEGPIFLDPGPPMDPRCTEWPSDIFARIAAEDRGFLGRLTAATVLFFCAPRPEHLVFQSARGWLAAQNFLRLAAQFREPCVSQAVHHWFEFHRPVLGRLLIWTPPRRALLHAVTGRAALRALARTTLPCHGGFPGVRFWRSLHERGPSAWQASAWAGRSLVEPDAFIPGLLRLASDRPMGAFRPWIRIAIEHPTCLDRWKSFRESVVEAREIDI